MLSDTGLIPAGGSTVFGKFPSAASGPACDEVPNVPGFRRSSRAAGVDHIHPLCKSPHCATLPEGPIGPEQPRMGSRFVRHQP